MTQASIAVYPNEQGRQAKMKGNMIDSKSRPEKVIMRKISEQQRHTERLLPSSPQPALADHSSPARQEEKKERD